MFQIRGSGWRSCDSKCLAAAHEFIVNRCPPERCPLPVLPYMMVVKLAPTCVPGLICEILHNWRPNSRMASAVFGKVAREFFCTGGITRRARTELVVSSSSCATMHGGLATNYQAEQQREQLTREAIGGLIAGTVRGLDPRTRPGIVSRGLSHDGQLSRCRGRGPGYSAQRLDLPESF